MEHSNFSIRGYKAADNTPLTDIWFAASQIAHGFLGAETLLAHKQLVSDIYLPQAETWVAELNGKPVGFLGLLENHIGGIFVDPACQGQGIGRKLIAHGLSIRSELTLDVYARNAATHEFYRKLGFVETSRRDQDAQGLPFEEISMLLKK